MLLTITKHDYLTIKALFHAVAKEGDRPSLCKVYYDKKLNLLVACDGYILRVETPESDFSNNHFFSKEEFLKSEKMLKNTELVQDCDPSDLPAYPKFARIVPNAGTIGDLKPLKIIAINLNLLKQFDASIINKAKTGKNIAFGFSSQLGAICCFGSSPGGETILEKFYGVIMPMRILGVNPYDCIFLPTLSSPLATGQKEQSKQVEKEEEEKAIRGVV